MKSTSELAKKIGKAKVCPELAQFLVAWVWDSPVLGSLSFGLELDTIYVAKIMLGSAFENIWWMDLKHKTDFEYWLFDFRFGLWKKKKENMAGWNTDDVIHWGLILFMKPFRFLTLKNWDLQS